MTEQYSFFVPGRPGSSGSKSIFPRKGGGKPIVAPDSKYQKPWQDSVKWAFMQTFGRPLPLTGPIELKITFYLQRPQGHYRRQKGQISHQLKPGAPIWHISRPDSGKLRRATEDALTGLAWRDDSQVCRATDEKFYVSEAHPTTGADIVISTMENSE